MDAYKEMLKNMLSTRQVTRRLLDLCERLDSESRKNAETSESARCEGSALFFKSDHGNNDHVHKKILELYNKSVMYAPLDSDKLTLAYAHRSALLLHVRRYEDCVQDVDRALRALIGNPNDAMKVKLLCRKAKCLSALGSRVGSRETFEEAEQALTDLQNDSGNIDEVLSKLLSSTKITLDKDEEDNARASASEPVSAPEREPTSLDSLLIRHTPEYGRHLVARRAFGPGEVLLVERLYTLNVASQHGLTMCAHCLAIGWSALACPNCAWALFCSEACRDEARRLYHDLECSVLPRLSCFDDELVKSFDACLRLLCRGFSELRSVQRIRSELQVVDQCEDVRLNGFVRDGKFESDTFRSILSLSDDVKDHAYTSDRFIKFVSLIVICLAKYTEVLGEHYKWNGIGELVDNDDAIFLGALIIKLYKINKINRQVILSPSRHCQTLSDSQRCLKKGCNVIALAISPLGSLINHSCIPNAAQCYTNGRKLIIYALKPIEENTQIFISYTNDYWTIPLHVRKRCLRYHKFTCACKACEEQWPCDENENGQFNELESLPGNFNENLMLYRKVADLSADILNFNAHDQELLTKISSTIDESMALMKEPNFVVGSLNTGFQVVFEHLNGIGQVDFYTCDSTEAPSRCLRDLKRTECVRL